MAHARQTQVGEATTPRNVIDNAVHVGRIAVGELPNDIRPEERMRAKLLMEAQSVFEAREAELEAALRLEAELAVGDTTITPQMRCRGRKLGPP